MADNTTHSLEKLAQEFDLTPRTARHYIEKLLPPHHKQGRGKQASYGRDTRNCFAFICKARAQKFTTAQISSLLCALSQEQIDRVACGVDELAIVPRPAEAPVELASSPCMAGDFPEFFTTRREIDGSCTGPASTKTVPPA